MKNEKQKPELNICMGSSCFARGNKENLVIIEEYLKEHNLTDEIDIELGCSLCQNLCNSGPNLSVNGKIYNNVDKGVTLDILRKLFEREY